MIKLHLINADIYRLYDVTCRINPRMDYAFCLLHIEEFWKMAIPLFGATGNFNHQILPYGILFLTFISTNVFYLLSFKFSPNLLRPWRFPLSLNNLSNFSKLLYQYMYSMSTYHLWLCRVYPISDSTCKSANLQRRLKGWVTTCIEFW